MNVLLDTCVISELIRPRPAAPVISWLDSIYEEHLYLSVVTLGELCKGIMRLDQNTRQAGRLQEWLDHDLAQRFQGRILPVDSSIALEWGRLCAAAEQSGRPRPVIDCLLAATARVHGLTLATRNTTDFADTGVAVFNPWQDGGNG